MLDAVDIQATVNQQFIYNQVTSITVYIKVPKYVDTFKGGKFPNTDERLEMFLDIIQNK